jgi:hypothetical protein
MIPLQHKDHDSAAAQGSWIMILLQHKDHDSAAAQKPGVMILLQHKDHDPAASSSPGKGEGGGVVWGGGGESPTLLHLPQISKGCLGNLHELLLQIFHLLLLPSGTLYSKLHESRPRCNVRAAHASQRILLQTLLNLHS